MSTEIHVLGRFRVSRDGVEVPATAFQGRLVRVLVRLLATRRGSFVPRDALVEDLWPAGPPADPDANLNILVTRARRALGDPTLIGTAEGGYAFSAAASCVVDAERFLELAAAGRTLLAGGAPAAALASLQAALELWGEPLAEDRYEDWAQPYRSRLAEAWQAALADAAAAALAAGRATLAHGWAVALTQDGPLRESGHLLAARALADLGDVAGALAVLAGFRARLADEAGLDPTDDFTVLEARLLRGERTAVRAEAVATGSAPSLPFLGRQPELATCLHAGGGVVLVAGTPGSGKSRLLAEVRREAALPVLAVRSAPMERDEPWGLARELIRQALALRPAAAAALPARAAQALADVVPELADLRPIPSAPLEVEARRTLVLEAGVQALAAAAEGGAFILVDDLQWSDASSLALIERVVQRLAGTRFVLAYRPEEGPPGSRLATFLAGLGRAPRVLLGPLAAADLGAGIASPELAACLAAETDGSPMAVAAVVEVLHRQGAIEQVDGRWQAAPAAVTLARDAARSGQQAALRERVREQAGPAAEALSALALLGRPAPASVLAAVLGLAAEAMLAHLQALARAGLVQVTPAGWLPAHDLIGEAVAAALPATDAARLHHLLAAALVAAGADRAEVGHHQALAGDREGAAAALAAAAAERLDRFAHQEALEVAEAGLALDPRPPVAARLREVRAAVRGRRGDLPGAREDLRAALAGATNGPDRARVLTDLALLASGAEDLALAAELAELATAEAAGDPGARARALSVAAIIDMNADRPADAERRSEEALALFRQVGDARGIAGILEARAMASFFSGDIAGAPAAFDRAARLFADHGDLLRVGTPRSTRGHALVFLARPADALADIQEALDLARTLGHAEGEAYALWHQAEALAGLGAGRAGEAQDAAARSLAIARRLGHREWTAAALRAVGIARQALGEPEGAEAAFRESLAVASELPLFAGWAAARIVLARVDQGRVEGGDLGELARRSMEEGPGISRHEGRLAACCLAVARHEETAADLVARCLPLARAAGHVVGARRLVTLLD